ncbi:hypothetical protein C1645_730976 [Glomus cerebriforme]|uniref:ATPase AAA-type core domain-containing protein n=1 Tax=Glomus cerebriforme TaxID=658196 RepID=A0A397TN21_9GLOM|nr:hypothetical protein C1645_730976 [Glomus cerebriforme]
MWHRSRRLKLKICNGFWALNTYNERLLNDIVERGTRSEIDVSDNEIVSRSLFVNRLKKIFQPSRNQSFYHVISGEHGTGKSTLIKIASNEVGCGVIYIDLPSNLSELGEAFGKAINCAFEKRISITRKLIQRFKENDEPKVSKWESAIRALNHASAVYKAKHNKPMVIIYDNVNCLVHTNQKSSIFSRTVQSTMLMTESISLYLSAVKVQCLKGWNYYLQSITARSAWSRVDIPVMEIGDLSKEESIIYLVDKRKVEKEEAKGLYDLVVIKQQVLTEVEKKFKTAQLYEDQQLHEAGNHVINALLNSKELGYLEFRRIFKNHYNPIGNGDKIAPDIAGCPNNAHVLQPLVHHSGPPPSDVNLLPNINNSRAHARVICEVDNTQGISSWITRCES